MVAPELEHYNCVPKNASCRTPRGTAGGTMEKGRGDWAWLRAQVCWSLLRQLRMQTLRLRQA